jgi:hypothetical protein
MNLKILSLALVFPAIVASSMPVFADTPVIQNLESPAISSQVIKTTPQAIDIKIEGSVNPIERVITKGEGGTSVKPKKVGPPPRRDLDGFFQFQNPSQLPSVNGNINAAPVVGQ